MKILIAEDEAVLRMDLQDRLQSLGHEVVGMTDTASESIRLAGLVKPDLIFMDIRLKGKMDGITAAGEIRERFQIPLIYLTAFNDSDTIDRAKLTEPCAYLHKPFQERDLRTAVDIGMHNAFTQEKLRKSENCYRTTVQHIGDGIITINQAGNITLLNPAAEELTGWTQTEAINQPLMQVFAVKNDRSKTALPDLVRDVIRSGKPNKIPEGTILRRKDGTFLPIADTIAPIFEQTDRPACGAVIAFRDVTEEHKQQAAFRHLQKLESLNQMSSGIAHDFNNLLTPILGYAELLRNELRDRSHAMHMLEQIELAAKKASHLTQQLLAYTGKSTITIRPVNINDAIRKTLSMIGSGISRQAQTHIELSPQVLMIDGDESQIHQVIYQLLLNASESLIHGMGHIQVKTGLRQVTENELQTVCGLTTAKAGEYIMLMVRDSGCGMSPETISRAFDPFFTTKFTGRGLGLSATLGIMQSHRGIMWLQSQPNVGTTIEVAFPKSLRHTVPVTPVKPSVKLRALAIQPNPAINEQLNTIFQQSGCEITLTNERLTELQHELPTLTNYDLFLIDLLDTDAQTIDLVCRIKQFHPHAKLILMINNVPDSIAKQLQRLGISGVLTKPFHAVQLSAILNNMINR